MSIWKNKAAGGKTFYTLLIPYLAILLATLLAGLLMFATVGRRYRDETEQLRAEQLGQLAVEVDYAFQYAIDLADNLLFNPKLRLVAREQPLIYTREDLRQAMLGADTQNRLTSLMVYLNHHDVILTRGVTRSFADYYQWYESLEGMSYEEYRDTYLVPYHLRAFMPPAMLQLHGVSGLTPVLPYVQSAPMRSVGAQPYAQIILYLDAREITGVLSDFAGDQHSHVYLVYPGGEAAFATSGAPAFSKWEREAQTRWQMDGKAYHVTTAPLASGAAQVVAVSDYAAFYAGWVNISRVMGVMVALYVIVGVLAAVMLARMNYRPIHEINALLGAEKGGNEYERIKRAVLRNHSDTQQMRTLIEQQRPMVLESYLLRLLNGPAALDWQDRRNLMELGIACEDRVFYVALCEFDMQSAFFAQEEQFPDENLRCARIIVENVGVEVLSGRFQTHYINLGRTGGGFLLSCPAPGDPELARDIAKYCDFVQAFALNECGLNLTMGISAAHAAIERLPQAQDEAMRALEHALMMRQGGNISYGELRPEEVQAHFYYPADTDARLSTLLRTGRFDEAKALIENLYTVNFGEKTLSVHAGRCFVYQVGTTVDRVLIGLPENSGGEQAEPLGELLRKLGGGISFETAKETTLEYVDKCGALTSARKVGQTEQLVERIARYIDENAADKWLDLGSLAQEFDVTPQYISHIFKRYRQENVKDYISRHKLEEAKRYLRETDLTGEIISQKIGYASEAGLIRLFKKYESVTPNVYRQAHRKSDSC